MRDLGTEATARTRDGRRIVVRARAGGDVPALVDVLAAQQARSRYPMRWPLPYPVERFVVRGGDEAAWVAELDGSVVGHVAVASAGEDAAAFLAALPGRRAAELTLVSTLFVAEAARGAGVGRRLLEVAVSWARARGRLPVLDVVPLNAAAVGVYRRGGWIEVGRARPSWLPDDAADVLLMVLPDVGARPDVSGGAPRPR